MERREDFPGITAEPTAVRRYPSPDKANAAQVLGYLSPVTDDEVAASEKTSNPLLRSDQVGRSGLESTYDEQLRGKAGVTKYQVDNLGRVIGKAGDTPATPGDNIVTSIDAKVQAVTEKELNDAMKEARKTVRHRSPTRTTRRTPAPRSSWTTRPARSSRWPASPPTTRTSGSAASRPRTTTR